MLFDLPQYSYYGLFFIFVFHNKIIVNADKRGSGVNCRKKVADKNNKHMQKSTVSSGIGCGGSSSTSSRSSINSSSDNSSVISKQMQSALSNYNTYSLIQSVTIAIAVVDFWINGRRERTPPIEWRCNSAPLYTVVASAHNNNTRPYTGDN